MYVKPKKYLGQHFLNDENIAFDIVDSLSKDCKNILEIGPGMGVLTKHLVKIPNVNFKAIEIDDESVDFLLKNYPQLENNIIKADFLEYSIDSVFTEPYAIIGNFPYNISTEILFRVLNNRDKVTEVVGMFQKEVALRIASKSHKKDYGIVSVLLQTFYDIEYLFTVDEHVFTPHPRVKSAVIKLTRNKVEKLDCDEKVFISIVKTGFNQRRKTLRNALKSMNFKKEFLSEKIFDKRAEELNIEDFVYLTKNLMG